MKRKSALKRRRGETQATTSREYSLSETDTHLIVAGIRSLQYYGPPPGYGEIPDTGGTDALAEDINCSSAVILRTGELAITPASYTKRDIEEHNATKLTTDEFLDFARYVEESAGIGETFREAMQDAFEQYQDARRQEGKERAGTPEPAIDF